MKIELKEIPIRDIFDGYEDNDELGVIGYGGKLNIRPEYQREFIYNDEQQKAVINTIVHNFPLNVMYWTKNSSGNYELMDGQQRTLSICKYVNGEYAFENRYFHNLKADERENILNYKLMIYFCEGTDKEKLDWFRVVNIAGEKLTEMERRNAIYSGTWTSNAKSKFSKRNCAAALLADKYVTARVDRQELFEKAIKWHIGKEDNDSIEQYMAQHQHDVNANELWLYFKNVIDWVKVTFINYRKEMKSVNWGVLYNQFKDGQYDTNKLEKEIARLMADDDITKKSGIYPYVLTCDEKHLNIRAFTDTMKRTVYEKQKGICNICHQHFEIDEMEADHITPWCEGGKTELNNCQMLCKHCNRTKSNR